MARSARVAAVVLVQLAIVAAVPFRQVRARTRGTPITLRTAPIDPFSAFGGHYATLTYEVEQPDAGKIERGLREGDEVWLTVAAAERAWTAVSVTRRRPAGASGLVSIRARYRVDWNGIGRAELEGASRFYLTERRGAEVDAARRERQAALVDLRVGDDGTPAIVGLRVAGLNLRDD